MQMKCTKLWRTVRQWRLKSSRRETVEVRKNSNTPLREKNNVFYFSLKNLMIWRPLTVHPKGSLSTASRCRWIFKSYVTINVCEIGAVWIAGEPCTWHFAEWHHTPYRRGLCTTPHLCKSTQPPVPSLVVRCLLLRTPM